MEAGPNLFLGAGAEELRGRRGEGVRIADIKIGQRYRKQLGGVKRLADSIQEIGLLHPVVVNTHGELIAGARRLAAAELLGWKEIAATVVPLDEVVRGEFAENTERQNFLPSEAVAIANAIKERIATPVGRPSGIKQTLLNKKRGQTRDKAAAYVGLSGYTLDKAEAVVDSGRADLVDLMDSTGKVDRAFKELKKSENRARLIDRPLPEGRYRVFYADPPWQYDNSGLEESAESHYPTMATDDICAMPIQDLAAEQSVLFLWSTNAFLEDALRVCKAWGFSYKTNLVWIKDRGPSIGWFCQSRHELLFIATRGSGVHPEEKPISWFRAENGKHSKKPECIYGLIEKMYPTGPYLELFSRAKYKNWEAWGNEI